jgi:branched-chain amino acid aminotransferase
MGLAVVRAPIAVDSLDQFQEVGACGTAAVITPVYSVTWRERKFTFGKRDAAGETLVKLYQTLQGIQYGEIPDAHGWLIPV